MAVDVTEIREQMLSFGLRLLGKAAYECTFMDLSVSHPSAVVTAASAAEILLKTRIFEVDPLRIFCRPAVAGRDLEKALERERTITFSQLPAQLKAVTGAPLDGEQAYRDFGYLRNRLVHLGAGPVPEDLTRLVLGFIFTVLEPLVQEWWGDSVFNYTNEYDDQTWLYLVPALDEHGHGGCVPAFVREDVGEEVAA